MAKVIDNNDTNVLDIGGKPLEYRYTIDNNVIINKTSTAPDIERIQSILLGRLEILGDIGVIDAESK